jgi:hypothetical protein
VANLRLRGIAKGRDATAPILLLPTLLLLQPQRIKDMLSFREELFSAAH